MSKTNKPKNQTAKNITAKPADKPDIKPNDQQSGGGNDQENKAPEAGQKDEDADSEDDGSKPDGSKPELDGAENQNDENGNSNAESSADADEVHEPEPASDEAYFPRLIEAPASFYCARHVDVRLNADQQTALKNLHYSLIQEGVEVPRSTDVIRWLLDQISKMPVHSEDIPA